MLKRNRNRADNLCRPLFSIDFLDSRTSRDITFVIAIVTRAIDSHCFALRELYSTNATFLRAFISRSLIKRRNLNRKFYPFAIYEHILVTTVLSARAIYFVRQNVTFYDSQIIRTRIIIFFMKFAKNRKFLKLIKKTNYSCFSP